MMMKLNSLSIRFHSAVHLHSFNALMTPNNQTEPQQSYSRSDCDPGACEQRGAGRVQAMLYFPAVWMR